MTEPTAPRVSDEKLADWSRRWPSTLPTSVPHEQVLMLILDLRDARRELEAAREALRRLLNWVEVETDGRDWPHPLLEDARRALRGEP